MAQPAVDIAALVDEVLASTPLRFVREFLRSQKKTGRRIRIGTTGEHAYSLMSRCRPKSSRNSRRMRRRPSCTEVSRRHAKRFVH
jgi:hypothetical protein